MEPRALDVRFDYGAELGGVRDAKTVGKGNKTAWEATLDSRAWRHLSGAKEHANGHGASVSDGL